MATIRHPLLGEVECVVSARSRGIRLTVKPSGAVRLSYPASVGRRRALAFLDAKAEWVAATQRRMAERRETIPHITRQEVERLRAEAARTLPPLTYALAERFGFEVGRVTVRAARTKWGSCSARNDISLSLFLAALPRHLQEFVIIHELCHTVHHNHSAAFHALVDRCLGGRERELEGELKRCRIPIVAEA